MSRLQSLWRRLLREDAGTVTVEFMLMTPLLAFAMVGILVFFDAQRTQSIDLKAALTIADVVSRERDVVGDTYVDGLYELQKFVNLHDKTPTLRVTLVRYHLKDEETETQDVTPHFHVVWSEVRGNGQAPHTDATVSGYTPRLPVMGDGDRLILVETWTDYEQPIDVGLRNDGFSTFTFASPRHVKVCFNNAPDDATQDIC